ncbi:MAG: ribosome biogenesis GTPase Der, partial [Candidatus Marinimicrobia bacterium]|nr:ribosome biogenesis GTPase Der [Candidatus Neomarinimicrobiota bacterium]
RVTTSELNAFFQKVIDKTPPPAMMGKYIRIKYVTQVKADPPVFAFFCNEPKLVKEDYQRFLENQIRKGFGFQGVPLTLSFREK